MAKRLGGEHARGILTPRTLRTGLSPVRARSPGEGDNLMVVTRRANRGNDRRTSRDRRLVRRVGAAQNKVSLGLRSDDADEAR